MTVIFDFDGTLANTLDLALRLYNEHADHFGGLPVNDDEIPHLRKLGYKKALKEKKIRWTTLPRLVLFITREMKKHMGEVEPYKGIVPMLNKLQNRGISIGVLTSNSAPLVQDFFKTHGFPVFDFVVSEKSLFGKDKALRKITKRHGLDKNRIVYVGDEPRDITSSRKAGVQVVGVSWGVGGVEGLEATPPDALVHNPKELFSVLERLASE